MTDFLKVYDNKFMIYAYCIESYLLDLVDRKNGFQTVGHELNLMVLTSIK